MAITASTQPDELTVEEAAVRARVSSATVNRWIRDNRVVSRFDEARNRRLIDRLDLERFIAGKPVANPKN